MNRLVSLTGSATAACGRNHPRTYVWSERTRVGDQWKIVSELYTVRDQHPNTAPDTRDVKSR